MSASSMATASCCVSKRIGAPRRTAPLVVIEAARAMLVATKRRPGRMSQSVKKNVIYIYYYLKFTLPYFRKLK